MESTLLLVYNDIINHGDITLRAIHPKQWKKTRKAISFKLADGENTNYIAVSIPSGLPLIFKENLLALVQEVCYKYNFSSVTVTEQE